MLRFYLTVIFLMTTGLALCGCSSGTSTLGPQGSVVQPWAGAEPGADLPAGLPVDVVQPWERLNADGLVAAVPGRSVTGINADSEFVPGFDTLLAGGDVADHGDSARLTGAAGSLAWAVYRCPLGGAEPGVVSVDANCWAGDGYYVGIADYGRVAWDWHGPFRDNHVRFSTAGADHTSALGITYICIAAWEGTGADVVGVGINPLDPGDTVAPPAPALLDATPVTGGVELNWLAVPDADVAGYLVCFAPASFNDVDAPGVNHLDYLLGDPTVTIPADEPAYFRVATMDLSGNLSDASLEAMAGPLPGTPPEVVLTTTVTECLRGSEVQLSATGAEAYDWDLDGDGNYDVMGDTTGSAQAVTTGAGLIRPRVRGYSGEPSCRACAAVSLVVSANSRPLATAFAFPASGVVALVVTLEGEALDYDGDVVGAGWDLDGDGAYDVWNESELEHLNPPPQTYPDPGLVNVRLRVVDNEGACDVATVAVNPLVEPENLPPVAAFTARPWCGPAPLLAGLNATGSTDPDGVVVQYEWDWESDGTYDLTLAEPECEHEYSTPGISRVTLRVTDDDGATATSAALITSQGPVITSIATTNYVSETALLVVEDNPAVFYIEYGTNDLKYVRATDTYGAAWGTPVTVAAGVDRLHNHGAAIVDGTPAVVYGKTGTVEYVRATDGTGTAWGTPASVNISGVINQPAPLVVVEGRPATAICYNNMPYGIIYSRADDATGSAWSSPTTVQNLSYQGYWIDMLVADGRPAVGFSVIDSTTTLYWERSDDATGTGWSATPGVIGGIYVSRFSLALVNGIPAAAWHQDDGVNQSIRYRRADDAAASTWMLNYPRVYLDQGWPYFNIELLDLNGRPAVACMDGHLVVPKYSHSGDPDGLNWPVLQIFDVGGDTGLGMSGAVVEGRAAFTYIDDFHGILRFCTMVE